VENKIDAPLTTYQLKTYNRVSGFRDARKIALVKHYFEMERVRDWTILHWADLHSMLKVSSEGGEPIDSFVIREFVAILKELGMARALLIERERLRKLAHFIKSLREPKPNHHLDSVTPFETATEYLGMLEDIVSQLHEEPLFRKRLGTKARFSPWFSWWYEDDDKKKAHPWLGVQIQLRKAYKGISWIATAILFYSKDDSFWDQSYTSYKSGTFLKSVPHKGNLRFEAYAKTAITFWKEQLA
jgi:hypothetical protein